MTALDAANLLTSWQEDEVRVMLREVFLSVQNGEPGADARLRRGLNDLASAKEIAAKALAEYTKPTA